MGILRKETRSTDLSHSRLELHIELEVYGHLVNKSFHMTL